MSTSQIPEGHLGNVSKEQEKCLKQMWNMMFAAETKGANAIKEADTSSLKSVGSKKEQKKQEETSAAELAESAKAIKELGYEKFHECFWGMPIAEHPDAIMLRFLRARKWDVTRSFAMLTCMIKWRIELNVNQIAVDGELVLNKDLPGFDLQMKSGKAYLHGADKQNRPCFYIHVQIHSPKQQSFEALRTFTIYSMEVGRMFLTAPTNQCCLVFDMTNFGLKNMDWPFIQFLVKAFEAYYPETLGILLIHKAPWVFSGIWKMIRPLLDPVVANKIAFTNSDKELLQYISAEQVEKGLGGKEEWVWEYTDPTPEENKRFMDKAARQEWINKRDQLRAKVEARTKAWCKSDDEKVTNEREMAILEYRIASIEADPYLRPRTVYHRQNNLKEDGTIEWDYKSSAGDQKFGVSLGTLQQELAQGGGGSSAAPTSNGNGHTTHTNSDSKEINGKVEAMTEHAQQPMAATA